MKKLLLITAFMLAINAFAQNPICITVNDTPCDENWSQNSVTNTTGNIIDGLWLFYDTGSDDNGVSWEIYDETQLYASGFNCGCGTLILSGFRLDAAHQITLKAKVKACESECSPTVGGKVRLYSPKVGNQCYEDCD